jgi:hypothetical protein
MNMTVVVVLVDTAVRVITPVPGRVGTLFVVHGSEVSGSRAGCQRASVDATRR